MTEEEIQEIKKGIADLQKVIENHNIKHESDMARMMPVIEAFEKSEQFAQNAKASGKAILWIAGFITAIGSAYLIVAQIFKH